MSSDIPVWDAEGVGVGRGEKQRNLEEEKEKDSVPGSLCSFPGATKTSIFPAIESNPSKKNFINIENKNSKESANASNTNEKRKKKVTHFSLFPSQAQSHLGTSQERNTPPKLTVDGFNRSSAARSDGTARPQNTATAVDQCEALYTRDRPVNPNCAGGSC